MIAAWFGMQGFMLIVYVVLDGPTSALEMLTGLWPGRHRSADRSSPHRSALALARSVAGRSGGPYRGLPKLLHPPLRLLPRVF